MQIAVRNVRIAGRKVLKQYSNTCTLTVRTVLPTATYFAGGAGGGFGRRSTPANCHAPPARRK